MSDLKTLTYDFKSVVLDHQIKSNIQNIKHIEQERLFSLGDSKEKRKKTKKRFKDAKRIKMESDIEVRLKSIHQI